MLVKIYREEVGRILKNKKFKIRKEKVMSKRKNLIALMGTVILLLSLFVSMVFAKEIPYGGRLSVGFPPGESIETLIPDEGWQYTEMGCVFWPLIYDQLWIVGPAPDYEAQPMLATNWETKDNKTWRVHIRKDATFHDGVPVTAEDVAFTMEYLINADPAWAQSHSVTEPGSIKVINNYTVEFTLKTAFGGKYLPFYWVPVLPKHIWEPYKDDMLSFPNEKCIGSGPFKLKEFKSGRYIWFEANKDYWGERPYLDEVVFKIYGSDDALYMALKKGEIDMIGYDGCSPLVVNDFKKAKNIRVIVSPGIGLYWLSFNLYKDTPLRDLNVRKAIMYGINKDKIIDVVYRGYANKADSFIYSELPEHNPNLPQYEYNTEKAKETLNNAGYVDTDNDGIRNDPSTGKDLAFELMVPSDWTSEIKTSRLIKEQLKDIGVDIIIKVLDLNTYYEYIYAPTEDKYEIGVGEEEPGPDADWVWQFCRSYEAGGEGWNTAYYNNSKFDETLGKMLAEKDIKKRKEYLYQMQMMISEDLPYGFLVRPDIIDPVRVDKIEGYVATMGGVSTWINPWTYFKVHLKK